MENFGLLSEYEQQFAVVSADVTSKICLIGAKDESDRRLLCQETNKLLLEAKELLEHMELEVRDAEPNLRERLKSRLKSYEVELLRLEDEYTRIKRSTNEGLIRSELLEFRISDSSRLSPEDEKQKLLNNTEKLEVTSVRLTEGFKIALETEQVGAQILNDLHSQRQTINSARNRWTLDFWH